MVYPAEGSFCTWKDSCVPYIIFYSPVGLFLPCRVTVMERDGKVLVTTINPLYLSRMFNNGELDEACEQMHRIYQSLIEDATL